MTDNLINYFKLDSKCIINVHILLLPDEDPLEYNDNDNDNVPLEYCCPISLKLMKDPIIANDGFTYDRKSLVNYFMKTKTKDIKSPMIRGDFNKFDKNYKLRELIKEFYKNEMGLKIVYMQAKLLRPSASENILDYLDKMV